MLGKNENFSIELTAGEQEVSHVHQEIELIYIVDGSAVITVEDEEKHLAAQDLLLINSARKHTVSVSNETVLFHFYASYPMLVKQLKEEYLLFLCDTTMEPDKDMMKLRGIIHQLILNQLQDRPETVFLQNGRIWQLMACLVEDFKVDQEKTGFYQDDPRTARMQVILNYINIHYTEPVSLSDIAGRLYISDSSLSRYFKKATGESIVDYINKVRLYHAREDLIKTEWPVTRIAVDNGFSTSSAFNRLFKAVYGVTPSAFRAEMKQETKKERILPAEKRQQLIHTLSAYQEKNKQADPVEGKTVTISLATECRHWRDISKIINMGDVSLMETARVQEQLLYLCRSLKFDYVRLWNFFPRQFMIAEDLSHSRYNFERLDNVLDFFASHRIRLFLDLGPRMNYVMVSGNDSLYAQNSQILPRNENEWRNLLENFMRHIVRRYGPETASSWIYELSAGTLPYYEGCEDYGKVFETGHQMIKQFLPEALVAGPGVMPSVGEAKVLRWLKGWKQSGIVPDLFTMTAFPYYVDETPEKLLNRRMTDDLFMRVLIEKTKSWLAQERLDIPLCVTEWSNSLSNRNPIQDSCARGTFIIRHMLSAWQDVCLAGFWYGSDWLSAYYDSSQALHGGAGLLSKDGICKPSYYAFAFLKQLQKYLIRAGNHFIATKNEQEDVYILCFNYKEYSTYYYLKDEMNYKSSELHKLFLDQNKLSLGFHLEALEEGQAYIIKKRTINEDNGDVLSKWLRLSAGGNLGSEEIAYLKQVCVPDIQIDRQTARLGSIDIQLVMKPHELTLLHVYKE